MSRKDKKNFVVSGILVLLFILFTLVIMKVDVRAIGPEHSKVGLATINQFIFEVCGVNLIWYHITDWLGVVAILFAFGFAVLGLVQLIKRKSIKRINPDIIVLGIFYVVVIAVYIFFETFIVNYRPIIIHEALEASYPSSHTMIVVCIMVTAMMQFHSLLKSKKLLVVLDTFSIMIIAVTVFGRLISGVHWFTDIIGGLLLSFALIMLYYSVVKIIQK